MSEEGTSAHNGAPLNAPWYTVPPRSVLSVEHPCQVKNVERAIDMLGGPEAISEVLQDPANRTLCLKFHPEDSASRGVLSMNPSTNNVLLQISVPKRTGRKRKRGTDDPFTEDTTDGVSRKDARYLLRSLRDNRPNYKIEPLGSIETTNIWRAMPDFVYTLRGSKFIEDFRSKIAPEQYPLIKTWDLPHTYGLNNTEAFPPPVLSNLQYTSNYSYRQNPAVKQITDRHTGAKFLHNTQAPMKIYTHQCQYDTPDFPSTTLDDCPPLHTQPENLQNLAKIMASIFAERPMWTRRALLNQIPPECPIFLTRYALAYVAFAIRSGPWRDTYCALGHDPRRDPSYRKYQTILLQLVSKLKENSEVDFQRKWSRSRDPTSHIFTGSGRVPDDGKVWQLCDITDPQIKSLVDIPERFIRPECDRRYFGWYLNGTNSKMRVVLKAKVDYLTAHDGQPEDPRAYESFLALPEEWHGPTKDAEGRIVEDVLGGYLGKDASRRQLEWASAYRTMCRTAPGSLPVGGGRLSKSKPDTRPSFLDADDERVQDRILRREEEEDDDDDASEDAAVIDRYNAPEDDDLADAFDRPEDENGGDDIDNVEEDDPSGSDDAYRPGNEEDKRDMDMYDSD